MKIAITADLHLNPEYSPNRSSSATVSSEPKSETIAYKNNIGRWSVLEEILENCREKGIEHLIIAGDLFDKKTSQTEIEPIFAKYNGIKIHIISGNHDDFLSKKYFSSSASNVFVYEEPEVKEIGDKSFVFIPCRSGSSVMQEFLKVKDRIPQGKPWVLVSHGDIIGEICEKTYEEKKLYFPLTQKDLNQIKPSIVLLGHIHQRLWKALYGNVFYIGSPCAYNENETGVRSYVILDLEKPLSAENVDLIKLHRGPIYYSKNVFVIPTGNETNFIKNQLNRILCDIATELCDDYKKYTKEEDIEPMLKQEISSRVNLSLNLKGVSSEGKKVLEDSMNNYLKDKVIFTVLNLNGIEISIDADVSLIAQQLHREVLKTFCSNEHFKGYKNTAVYSLQEGDSDEILLEALAKIIP